MHSIRVKPLLRGVPETMLWALHNRAGEARRANGILRDDHALQIHAALDYDFDGNFGKAEPSHAVRAAMLDAELRRFLAAHPTGVVVNLGEGLETQRYRVAGTEAHWISVDLPVAMSLREQFIRPSAGHQHIASSASSTAWMNAVPTNRPLFITAQGLLMYLPEATVAEIIRALASRFPGSWLAFDAIPRWLSRKTLGRGWHKSKQYRTPPMPWGVNANQVEATLRSWAPTISEVIHLPWWRFPRGYGRWLFPLLVRTPGLKRFAPTLTRVRFGAPARERTEGANERASP